MMIVVSLSYILGRWKAEIDFEEVRGYWVGLDSMGFGRSSWFPRMSCFDRCWGRLAGWLAERNFGSFHHSC